MVHIWDLFHVSKLLRFTWRDFRYLPKHKGLWDLPNFAITKARPSMAAARAPETRSEWSFHLLHFLCPIWSSHSDRLHLLPSCFMCTRLRMHAAECRATEARSKHAAAFNLVSTFVLIHNPVQEASVILLGIGVNKGVVERLWYCL